MRELPRVAIAFVFAGLGGCSLLTTWDGLTSGGGAPAGGGGVVGSPVGGAGGGSAGGAGGGGAGGGAGDAGTGGGDTSDADAGAVACMPGGRYCGGDKLMGDPGTLYLCSADGTGSVVEACAHGCVVYPPGQDDACGCQPGGAYCGGDEVIGDPNTLYRCIAGNSGSVIMVCTNSCQVLPNQDDVCQ